MSGPEAAASFDPLAIVATPSSLEGADEHKLAYIQALMAIAKDDVNHLRLYVTLALGTAVLFITQVPLDRLLGLPPWTRLCLVVGLAALVLSAVFYFRYIRQLHIVRMRLARCIPSLDVLRARELWAGQAGVWQKHKANYWAGLALLAAGICLEGTVVIQLLLFSEAIADL